MKIIEQNEGTKIPYNVVGKTINFDETVSVNLSKYQKDEEVVVDVCLDRDMQLGFGLNGSIGQYVWYVANIVIPPKEYEMVETGQVDENENPIYNKVVQPLNMNDVTIYLWALPDNYIIGGGF
ncbi:hypothetical protein [Clostridium lundense]|uniref:hypothetical protein n=1 Tax=Clostridium lundense TaxID=319475 RepID=UPI00047FADC0|nr:hypothetical protein [Clostridium lundense]